MSLKAKRFMVLTPDGDALFDCDSQSWVFKNLKTVGEGIAADLGEPESEDMDTGLINTKRSEGLTSKDYRVFVEVVHVQT